MRENGEPKRPHLERKRRTQSATTSARGYGYDWQRLRSVWMNAEPRYCVLCARKGLIVAATVVDHIIPHAGDDKLRLDWNNLQGLCVRCHTWKTVTYDGGLGNDRQPFPLAPVPTLEELLANLETKKG